jgi:hypothetical protein
MSNMATIHITRAEAVRDIENVLDQAAAGTDIVIESETGGSLLLLQGGGISEEATDPEHEAWLDAEMREGLREANDLNAVWIPNEVVTADFLARRVQLLARIEEEEKAKAS